MSPSIFSELFPHFASQTKALEKQIQQAESITCHQLLGPEPIPRPDSLKIIKCRHLIPHHPEGCVETMVVAAI
jgi:hypothetical protein